MELKTIGIIGAGKMGQDIFYFLTDYDFKIKWMCNEKSFMLQKEKFNKKIGQKQKRGMIDENEANYKRENIKIINDYNELKDCDFIIETITEDLDKKKDLFKLLDTIVNEKCIIVSNSSGINPVYLMSSKKRGCKIVGLHFFYPVKLINFFELNKTVETDDLTVKTIIEFAEKIDKKVLVLDDKNHYLLNKVFLDFQSEAFILKKELNLSFSQIDHVIRKYIFPIGVFEFFDHVGIDVMFNAVKNYISEFENKEYYKIMTDELELMINSGNLGIKTNKGFYDYPYESKKEEPAVSEKSEILIKERLISVFLKSFDKYQKSSKIKPEILNEFIKVYMHSNIGPLEMINKNINYSL